MKPYLEPRFLGVLILRTRRAALAQKQMERFQAPYAVSPLTIVEIEHLLYWGQQHAPLITPSRHGKRQWDYFFSEGIFQMEVPDWDSGFRLARASMRQAQRLENSWSMYLHAALAVSVRATHYLSFQTSYRNVAKTFGLRLLPEGL
jgi:hypothetical protein